MPKDNISKKHLFSELPTCATCELFDHLLYCSVHLLCPLSHPSFHPSIMTQMAIQEFLSGPLPSLCSSHTITPIPPPFFLLFYISRTSQKAQTYTHLQISTPSTMLVRTWSYAIILIYKCWDKLVMKESQNVWSLFVCEGHLTKRSPQRELSAFGPWGLSGGIIDDVFITRCGVMWGLGHNMCVCVRVCACVYMGNGGWAGWLSCRFLDTNHSLRMVRTSHCFQMPSYKYTHLHKHQTLVLKDRCTQTHSPEPIPFPEIKYLKPNKNAENKSNLFLLSQFHARPLAELSVSILLGRLWNLHTVAPNNLTATSIKLRPNLRRKFAHYSITTDMSLFSFMNNFFKKH